MRTFITKIMMFATFLSFLGCKSGIDPSSWSEKKIDDWFDKGEWKNGWNVVPDKSINKKSFALAYYSHKERWDSAFNFLKTADLKNLELKRHDLDGDKLFVSPSEYNTKNEADANFEAHRKYIDIQYVASGKEIIGFAPLSSKDSVVQEYNNDKDVEFMTVRGGSNAVADPGRFFIFFPDDAHKPGLKIDTIAPVKKIVIKVRIN
jgi:YhcH/YjgK/YiaL family protein